MTVEFDEVICSGSAGNLPRHPVRIDISFHVSRALKVFEIRGVEEFMVFSGFDVEHCVV